MLWGYRGNVWGVFGWIWVEFMEIGGAQMCLGGIWVLNPCSMEWKHYFGTALNGTVFCQLTILRHQNTKNRLKSLWLFLKVFSAVLMKATYQNTIAIYLNSCFLSKMSYLDIFHFAHGVTETLLKGWSIEKKWCLTIFAKSLKLNFIVKVHNDHINLFTMTTLICSISHLCHCLLFKSHNINSRILHMLAL